MNRYTAPIFGISSLGAGGALGAVAQDWFFGPQDAPEPPTTSMIDYIITFVRRRGR